MAYGFTANGADGSFLLDSELTATEHFSIKALETDRTTLAENKSGSDIVFAKPASTSSDAVSRVTADTVYSATQVSFYQPVNYIVLKRDQLQSVTGNYGLQVKNPGGTTIFDSRAGTGNGFKPIGTSPRGTLGGNFQPGNPAVSTSLNKVGISSGNSTQVYQGNPANVYVLVAGGYYSIAGSSSIMINSFYYEWSGSDAGIYLESFFYININGSSGEFSNFADIIRGEFIT